MPSDRLTSTLAALADPTRRAILAHLMSGEATVTELAEPFEMSFAAVAKHIKVLEEAGLISRGRAAQWRPCRIHPAPLKEVADWVENYRMAWEQRLDRLHDYLAEVQAKEKKRGRNKK
ncbi:MAG TPA: metalloregulator ArsR/SmtB family transcription factor [Candidatus Acidoferrum sp.]|jgi:DNA-binding transcriptional ArsR family regulator|nr:metalloregulator ArsR/SmtB family transcription factor [Candidatus Acidoferrum sp.]